MLKEPQLHLLRQRLAANEGDGDVAAAGAPTAPPRGRAESGSLCRRRGQEGGALSVPAHYASLTLQILCLLETCA